MTRIRKPVLTRLLFAAGKTGMRLRDYKHRGRVFHFALYIYEGGYFT